MRETLFGCVDVMTAQQRQSKQEEEDESHA